MKPICAKTHTKIFKVFIKNGRVLDHNCSHFNKETKACMFSKIIPPPICELYGRGCGEKEEKEDDKNAE